MNDDLLIVVKHPDGSEVDVTEGVRTLYDHVVGSMDWGSGFLTVEDAMEIVHIARTCGFDAYKEAQEQVVALRTSELLRPMVKSDLTRNPEQHHFLAVGIHGYEVHSGNCDRCKLLRIEAQTEAWAELNIDEEQP